MRVRKPFWVLLILMALCILAAYNTSAVQNQVFIRAVYFGFFLIIISWFWAASAVTNYNLNREVRGVRQELGQIVEERFELINRSRFTRPWLELRDRSGLPGVGGSRVLSTIGPNERRNFSAYTVLTRRGEYNLGPTQLISGDPFGFFLRQSTIPASQTLLVLPYMVNLDHFPFPAGFLPGGKTHRFKTLEVTPHAASVREYAPGDPLSRIHWPSSARKDRLIVKEFEQDIQADVWILVDADQATHFVDTEEKSKRQAEQIISDQFAVVRLNRQKFSLPPDSFEYVVSAAASITKYFIQIGRGVGLSSVGQQRIVLPPEKGERQFSKIIESLALLQPLGKILFPAVTAAQTQVINRGSTVVLITSAVNTGTLSAAANAAQRNLNPVVVLISGQSFGGPEDDPSVQAVLRQQKIPTVMVRKGDPLRETLNFGFY